MIRRILTWVSRKLWIDPDWMKRWRDEELAAKREVHRILQQAQGIRQRVNVEDWP